MLGEYLELKDDRTVVQLVAHSWFLTQDYTYFVYRPDFVNFFDASIIFCTSRLAVAIVALTKSTGNYITGICMVCLSLANFVKNIYSISQFSFCFS